jgi:hypothetical protein
VLLGTDYVYPRTTKKILRAFLNAKGMRDDIVETYTPFGHSDLQTIVTEVKEFASQGKQPRFGCVREKGRRENGEGSEMSLTAACTGFGEIARRRRILRRSGRPQGAEKEYPD